MPAHITLPYPWYTPPIPDEALARLRAALDGFAAYSLLFRGIGRFDRTLYLRPDDNGQTAELMARITAAFPDHLPYGGRFVNQVPHLTVADVEEPLEPIIAGAPSLLVGLPLESRAAAVTVMESNDEGWWSTRADIPLV